VYSTPSDGKPNRILKQENMLGSYKRVTLSKDGEVKRFQVHRLVAQTFIKKKNIENYQVVNHIDNNPSNNHYSNLEWCTQKDHISHADMQDRCKHVFKAGGDALVALNKIETDNKLMHLLGARFIKTYRDKKKIKLNAVSIVNVG